MRIIVTTPLRKQVLSTEGQTFIGAGIFPYVPRLGRSLSGLRQDYEAEGVMVWHQQGPILHLEKEKFFFHPGMAYNRLLAYRNREQADPMAKACRFQDGDFFLDCTLGLGADAIVASYFLPRGTVKGLETSPAVAQVIHWGMRMYHSKHPWLNEAVRRIQVINMNHVDLLRQMPDCSVDIVYFDPMFRKPLLDSPAMLLLRSIADTAALSSAAIQEACRVAKKRVVLKERYDSGEFQRLGFKQLNGRRNSPVEFGVIEI